MALFNLTSAAEALEDLLDRERSLIKSGRIDAVVRLGHEKERLLGRLSRHPDGADILRRLQSTAERNQALLTAAARGIKAAANRLETIRAGQPGLRTYGRDGAATDLARRRSGIDKQA